jgi:hypothetical protein
MLEPVFQQLIGSQVPIRKHASITSTTVTTLDFQVEPEHNIHFNKRKWPSLLPRKANRFNRAEVLPRFSQPAG